jgi:hypothetical protein
MANLITESQTPNREIIEMEPRDFFFSRNAVKCYPVFRSSALLRHGTSQEVTTLVLKQTVFIKLVLDKFD